MNKIIRNGLVTILLLFTAIQTIGTMLYNSATEDEPVYISTGYIQITNNYFGMETRNPPLVRSLQAIPLLFLNLRMPQVNDEELKNKYIVGERFLYHNTVPANKILFWTRVPTLIFTLVLGFFIFLWSKKLYGTNAGILALFLYSFSPNILAHSGLATNDLGVTFFMFMSAYFFSLFLQKRNYINAILMGLFLGGAITSKFTSGVLVPILVIVYFFYWDKKKFGADIIKIIVSVLSAFLIVLISYNFSSILFFFSGLFVTLRDLKIGHDNFFLGEHSKNGWRQFYVLSTLISTPIPVLILFGVLLVQKFSSKTNKFKKEDIILFLPMILLFIVASLSNKQSHRYILPVYPLLFVALGSLMKTSEAANKWSHYFTGRKLWGYLFVALGLWSIVSAVTIYPYYLDYYNEFIGGPKNGNKYLISDWGQNLYEFKQYWEKEGSPYLILGYYGGGQPEHEGISYQDLWTDHCAFYKPVINPVKVDRELLVISHDYLCGQHFETEKKVFTWLEKFKPTKRIGYSIFVYDVTNEPKIHENLASMYYLTGNNELSIRECQRTLLLDPKNQPVKLVLALVYMQQNKFSAAVEEYLKLGAKHIETPDLSYLKFAQNSYAAGLVSLGYHLGQAGKTGDSVLLYEKAIEIAPDSAQGYFGLGALYQQQGMAAKAEELYKTALEKEPNNADIRYNLGLIYWNRGDKQRARTEFEKVLLIKPDYAAVKQYLR